MFTGLLYVEELPVVVVVEPRLVELVPVATLPVVVGLRVTLSVFVFPLV